MAEGLSNAGIAAALVMRRDLPATQGGRDPQCPVPPLPVGVRPTMTRWDRKNCQGL